MECKIFIIIFSFFGVNYISCHLKDIGEKKGNWTKTILKHREMRIIEGTPTSVKEFPFNVQFINYGAMCGGSILTTKTVLTAAHCFNHNKNKAEMIILSNPRYVFDPRADYHDVWDFKVHEDYNKETSFASDIAILLIHDNFVLNENVQKVMLSTTFTWMKETETFIATGWGETKYERPVTNNILSKVNLTYMDKKKCMKWNDGITLSRDMFCLYGDGVRDTCRGDSGGGILWRGVLVGITSHGRGCADTPGVYVNVGYFIKWITDTVALLTYNSCLFHNLH